MDWLVHITTLAISKDNIFILLIIILLLIIIVSLTIKNVGRGFCDYLSMFGVFHIYQKQSKILVLLCCGTKRLMVVLGSVAEPAIWLALASATPNLLHLLSYTVLTLHRFTKLYRINTTSIY